MQKLQCAVRPLFRLCWLSNLALLSALYLIFFLFFFQSRAWASDRFEYILLNQRSSFTTCGNFRYSRLRRRCEKQANLDFKKCIQAEHSQPLYQKSSRTAYHCFNTRTYQGKTIIKELLAENTSVSQCFERKIYQLHENVISHPKFSEILVSFKERLGFQIKIHYAFDMTNRRGTVQLLVDPAKKRSLASHKSSRKQEDSSSAITLLSNSNTPPESDDPALPFCPPLNTKKILNKVATLFQSKLSSKLGSPNR